MTDAPPPPGHMTLHDRATPALEQGAYKLQVDTDLNDAAKAIGPGTYTHAFTVTGPHYRLDASDVLVVHPADGATGAFAEALPHVVLRRHTLPWERDVGGTPWLGLIVAAEGEVTIDETATAPDGGACRVLRFVDQATRAVVPTPADAALLCHVRRVNTDDRALSAGDEDGWVAVVVAPRLPAATGAHRAYLVSLEDAQGGYYVLHDWGWTCQAPGGTFRDVVTALDVGLLGGAGVALTRIARDGSAGQAIYHGPAVGIAAADSAYAVAFELGRLLAGADMATLRAITQWRRAGTGPAASLAPRAAVPPRYDRLTALPAMRRRRP